MLRIILLIVISYIVVRIALRMLLSGAPAQRSTGTQGVSGTKNAHPFFRGGTFDSRPYRDGQTNPSDPRRFDNIEDADFEEIPPQQTGTKRPDK